MPPQLSIIVPAFNPDARLERALTSVLDQIDERAELILVDDASATPLRESLPQGLRDRLRIERLDENSGPAQARNHGVDVAAGCWLTFLDYDDAWLPGRFEQIKGWMDQDQNGLVAWTCAVLRITRKNALRHQMVPKRGLQRPLNQGGCRMSPGSSLLIRRSTFEEVGPFEPKMRRLEDFDWFMRFYALGGTVEQFKDARVFIDRAGGAGLETMIESIQIYMSAYINPPKIIRAYLHLEAARSAYQDKRHGMMIWHLFLSRNLWRRFGLQIQPLRSRRLKPKELSLLSALKSVSDEQTEGH